MNRPDAVRLPILLLTLALAAVALPGCPTTPEPPPPLLSRDELFATYNLRAHSIATLRAKCHIEARLSKLNEKGEPIPDKVDTYSLDGTLRLRKPRDLRLVGSAFGKEMFGLHSNAEKYWMWVNADAQHQQESFGRHDGPGAQKFPVRPDLLLQALAIYPLPPDMRVFLRGDQHDIFLTLGVDVEPATAPEDKVSADTQVKVLPYLIQEIRLERLHHDPVEVRLYRRDGSLLLVAMLSDYQAVPSCVENDVVKEKQRLPMKIEYRFMPIEWTFKLELSEVSLTEKLGSPTLFDYRPTGFANTVDLDAEAILDGVKSGK
jgi:hypothetical protein